MTNKRGKNMFAVKLYPLFFLLLFGCSAKQKEIEKKEYELTISTSSGGEVIGYRGSCTQQCIFYVARDTTISISAKADTGYIFDGWDGDCTGLETCNVIMDKPRTIKANFISSRL
jgi:uncharacterized repeat protein (TIGR02543 family)